MSCSKYVYTYTCRAYIPEYIKPSMANQNTELYVIPQEILNEQLPRVKSNCGKYSENNSTWEILRRKISDDKEFQQKAFLKIVFHLEYLSWKR